MGNKVLYAAEQEVMKNDKNKSTNPSSNLEEGYSKNVKYVKSKLYI